VGQILDQSPHTVLIMCPRLVNSPSRPGLWPFLWPRLAVRRKIGTDRSGYLPQYNNAGSCGGWCRVYRARRARRTGDVRWTHACRASM